MMNRTIVASALIFATTSVALAQAPTAAAPSSPAPIASPSTDAKIVEILSSVPSGSLALGTWYKQNVYDMTNTKIGDITDVLISPIDGKVTAVIIGVGGFLGMDQKDIGVAFDAVKRSMKDGKPYLSINTTKEALSKARSLKYDSNTSMWITADLTAK